MQYMASINVNRYFIANLEAKAIHLCVQMACHTTRIYRLRDRSIGDHFVPDQAALARRGRCGSRWDGAELLFKRVRRIKLAGTIGKRSGTEHRVGGTLDSIRGFTTGGPNVHRRDQTSSTMAQQWSYRIQVSRIRRSFSHRINCLL